MKEKGPTLQEKKDSDANDYGTLDNTYCSNKAYAKVAPPLSRRTQPLRARRSHGRLPAPPLQPPYRLVVLPFETS